MTDDRPEASSDEPTEVIADTVERPLSTDATVPLAASDAAPEFAPAEPDAASESAQAEPAASAATPLWKRPLMIVASAIVLVALAAGIAWWVVTSSAEARDKALRDTATSYLTALSEGNAQNAIKLLAQEPANKDLLTDEVLKESLKTTPLTDIAVSAVRSDKGEGSASVTYKLGAEQVTADILLVGDGRTTWKVADGLSELMVTNVKGLRINGVTLSQTTNPVFPGTYTAAPSVEQVALDGATTVTIPDPGTPVATLSVTPKLSEAGLGQARAAGKAALDACVATNVSAPPGCPWQLDESGVQLTPGTLRYKLVNDPWGSFAPTLDVATMTAKGTAHYTVEATANATRDGMTGDVTANIDRDTPVTIDFTENPPKLIWA